ncbi:MULTISPECIES: AAA family ATPase [Rhodonellum]|uniref:AAA domain-containing protein n=1 Tax=Rhodonellum ikkaensis TaxID=336829 RepID=A0A1H3TH60_9BACT|nr:MULTISPECIES: AAA family ATPase [Rhodonellum]SDZ48669.1 AAA domain-containing protein [Rhodonellum ikkaensis]
MHLRISKRSQARIRIALQGPSGSGKTYSSLLLAYGLVGDWSKIAVIDTENQSADLYANLGDYNVISPGLPYTPEKYMEAIQCCENAGMEAIVIDSLSHEWETLLDIHSNMPGNSFTNWSKITPRHNHLINKILSSTAHIITTVRSKQDYVLTEKNGKQVPEKVGMKGVQRDGLEYDFTIVFDINIKHFASASKDRTGIFGSLPDFRITAETGEMIKNWCLSSEPSVEADPKDFLEAIQSCKSLDQLYRLYNENPSLQELHKEEFVTQKSKLLTPQNFRSNGTTAH